MTPQVLNVAQRLMRLGANLTEINERTVKQQPFDVMRLWGLALGKMRMEGHVIWTQIPLTMRRAGRRA